MIDTTSSGMTCSLVVTKLDINRPSATAQKAVSQVAMINSISPLPNITADDGPGFTASTSSTSTIDWIRVSRPKIASLLHR